MPVEKNGARMPDFIIIGAMRAATTTLHRYLDAHPGIGMSREKETDFFVAELNFDRGLDWYRSLFPATGGLLGEASPNYGKCDVFKGVPERIKAAIPDARLIYVVRDPVKRAISHQSFAANIGRDVNDPKLIRHVLETSRYAVQIEEYYKVFSRDQVLILDYEELSAQPAVALGKVGSFLGLTGDWPALTSERTNDSGSLSRMPLWFLRLRRNRLINDLRRGLPDGVRQGLRRLVELGPARGVKTADDARIEQFKAELAEDARRFRELTGMPFAGWTV